MSKEVGEVRDWASELATFAQNDKAREKVPAGNPLKIDGGQFEYQGENIGDNITAVVVDYAFINTFYKSIYNPDDIEPPECFAIASSEGELAPHDNAAEKQHDACAGCPQNKFGTARVGKGKACQNRRSLVVVPYNEDRVDDFVSGKVEPAFLKLAPTSIKNWSSYVNKVATAYNRPVFGVVTRIRLEKKGTYSVAHFDCGGLLNDNDTLERIVALREEVNPILYKPYEKQEEETDAKYT